mmetsp:Transcript_71185/g.231253  ORF Transcript_71185/g.231253 Transcript_71185/m.231253 type:complete len:627 (-) Transcript_71185:82-1962(-)
MEDIAALQELLEKCSDQIREQRSDFRARSYLLPVLERLQGTPETSELVHVRQHRHGAVLIAVARDAVAACLLILAVLEDRAAAADGGGGGGAASRGAAPLPRLDALWPGVALRKQAERLAAVVAAVAKGQDQWEPTTLIGGGALAAFWRRHFQGRLAVKFDELLAALAASYETLSDGAQADLRAWLQPDTDGNVSVLDAVAVLDAPGPWRGILFCSSWPELFGEELQQALLAAGGDRHLALTAADLTAEALKRRCAVLLPGWSRRRLCSSRRVFRALRTVGMTAAADIANGGLLLQFPFDGLPQSLQNPNSALMQTLFELTGDTDVVAGSVGRVSIALCVSEEAARLFRIRDERSRHVAMAAIQRRTRLKNWDDLEEMLELQQRHKAFVQGRLPDAGGYAEAPDLASVPAGGAALAAGGAAAPVGGARPGLRALLGENRAAFLECSLCIHEKIEDDLRSNAEALSPELARSAEAQLASLEEEGLFADEELELLLEVNFCMNRQVQTHKDTSSMERALVSLEATFDEKRRRLTRRGAELSRRIGEAERELASLSTGLAAKREAGRAAADAVLDAQLVLAEAMVPAPMGLGISDALEERLGAEVVALRQRSEELQRRFTKAKAVAKKR